MLKFYILNFGFEFYLEFGFWTLRFFSRKDAKAQRKTPISKHLIQTFPLHLPASIIGKSGVGCSAAVVSCTHQGNGA